MAKRVVTISEQELPSLAQKLLDQMAADGFVPDALLGIATGGAIIVDSLPPGSAISRFTCTMQRRSTALKQKSRFGRRVLSKMPYFVTDTLRLIEDRVGQRSTPSPAPPPNFEQSINAVAEAARKQNLHCIAVIDDAVDSGVTLACVTEALRAAVARMLQSAAVRSLARAPRPRLFISQTSQSTRTLLSFSLVFDYKGIP